jgi:hypothetical protein
MGAMNPAGDWTLAIPGRICDLRGRDPRPIGTNQFHSCGRHTQMTHVRLLVGGLMTTFALALAVGCEDKPSVDTSTAEGTVKGTVTVGGKLATRGEVQFDPANYKRKDVSARKAKINEDGTYTITTLTGSNSVSVNTPELQKKTAGLYQQLSLDVQSGENKFDIVIP